MIYLPFLVAPAIASWLIFAKRNKMRAERIEAFKTKLRELDYIEIDATAAIRDGKRSPQDVLAEMYADLGQERDDFETKAKHADTLRAEADILREKAEKTLVEMEKKLVKIQGIANHLRVGLNSVYGKIVTIAATPAHTSIKGTERLVDLLKMPSEVREKAVGKLGVRILRKLLPIALAEIKCVGHKLAAESARADLAFEQGLEEERARSTARIQHLSERSDKVDEKIKETDARLTLIKEMLLDYQKQRDNSLAREAELKKAVDHSKADIYDLEMRLSNLRRYGKGLLTEKNALIALYRAQKTIVDQHLDQGEQSDKVP